MNYVLRYGTERGKGDYVTPLGRSMYQHNATRIARHALGAIIRASDVRLVRLRPKRTLIGYVVRLDGPGEEPRWLGVDGEPTASPRCRYVFVDRATAGKMGGSRVVPVYLRVRP